MGRRVSAYSLALVLGALAGVATGIAAEGASVTGIVRVDGAVPATKEWKLDEAMRRATGEKVYRDEAWLVGKNKGLANCVVALRPIRPEGRAAPRPSGKAYLDKVGVRYVPRVLVVVPGTEVVL